ncbi:MAG: carboxyl-terminal processing protease [Solirubrobacteraceae bacterium]|jgi:carboxyl-terminal processing protease|nr:carboxyl-terminal processing protease [Solirubrobacteraceae bacterium]
MTPSRRQPLTALLAGLLPVLLLAGLWLGGHPNELPPFLRKAFVADQQTRVVDEAIQRIETDYYRRVPPGKLADASINGVIATLGDRFSHYLTPAELHEFNTPPHFTGIGVSVGPQHRGLLIARVFDASPAARAGLKAGDLIVAVNGRKLEGLSADQAIALIKGAPGTDVGLAVERSGRHAPRTVKITRATISEPVVASATKTLHGKRLGVVALATFTAGAHLEVRDAVEGELRARARGIVLDLRANGGGLVEEAQLVASIFIAKGAIVSTRGRSQPSVTLTATGGAISGRIPLVVLVDSNTASAAEIVTSALQDHRRATVVGTHTFGKGVFQEQEPLSNGGALEITVGEYFTPDGRNLGGGGVKQGAGVTPEVRVASGVDTSHGLAVALDTLAAKAR